MVSKIENPFEDQGRVDPAYNKEQYEREREMIARGRNPYNAEENIGFEHYEDGTYEDEDLELIREEGVGEDDSSKLEKMVRKDRGVKTKNTSRGRINPLNYLKLLEDNRRIGIFGDNYQNHVGNMKRLLRQYFSRFRKGGKQDLEARGYEPIEIWRIYEAILDYARKVQKKFRGY